MLRGVLRRDRRSRGLSAAALEATVEPGEIAIHRRRAPAPLGDRPDDLCQLGPRVGEGSAHAHDRLIDRAERDRDGEDLAHDVSDLATREPEDAGQRGDVRLEARPERRAGGPRSQLGQPTKATAGTHQAVKPVLEDQRLDPGQLPLLMGHRLAQALLGAVEAVSALTRPRQVLEALVDSIWGGQLAALALVAGLAARLSLRGLRALTSQRATLLAGHRRIRGRRHRAVARATVLATLELLDALAQRRDLLKQPNGQLPRRLPARPRDRLYLLSPHARKIPCAAQEPCSARRHPVNAYHLGAPLYYIARLPSPCKNRRLEG